MSEQVSHVTQAASLLESAAFIEHNQLGGEATEIHENFLTNIFNIADSVHTSNPDLTVEVEAVQDRVLQKSAVQGHRDYKAIKQTWQLGSILETLDPPQFLYDTFGAKSSADLARKVLLEDPTQPNSAAKIMNFFEWQSTVLAKRRKDFQEKKLPELFAITDQYLIQGAEQGIIPADSVFKFQKIRSQGKLFVEETFATTHLSKEDSTMNAAAFNYPDGTAAILLSLLRRSDSPKTIHTFVHEALHVIDGKSINGQVETAEEIGRNSGLLRLFGDGILAVAINEATTEHAADSIIHGNVHAVGPTLEERINSNSYMAERSLLSVLCYGGSREVNPELFIAAMMEDGPVIKGSAGDQLEHQLKRAFTGVDIVNMIRNYHVPDGVNTYDSFLDLANKLMDLPIGVSIVRRIGQKITKKLVAK